MTASQALTERELEVLERMAGGGSNKQIAAALHISIKTVETHVTHIHAKLGVVSRTQAIAYALCAGLVSAPDIRGFPNGRAL